MEYRLRDGKHGQRVPICRRVWSDSQTGEEIRTRTWESTGVDEPERLPEGVARNEEPEGVARNEEPDVGGVSVLDGVSVKGEPDAV